MKAHKSTIFLALCCLMFVITLLVNLRASRQYNDEIRPEHVHKLLKEIDSEADKRWTLVSRDIQAIKEKLGITE